MAKRFSPILISAPSLELVEKREGMLVNAFDEARLLPRGTLRYLASCPHTGGGNINHWIFGAACSLQKRQVPGDKIDAMIRIGMAGCGRDERPGEIDRAIERSALYVNGEAQTVDGFGKAGHAWPEVNSLLLHTILEERPFSKQQLIDATTIKPSEIKTREIVQILFPGNPLICVGPDRYRPWTRPVSFFGDTFENNEYIVPSPMKNRFGRTTDGKLSERSSNNVGDRRFLIVEADSAIDADSQTAVLWYLQDYLPLAMVVHSGNKSYHGWFYVAGADEAVLRDFMAHAVSLGADDQMWVACQWARMPNGFRNDNGRVQPVIYFNPQVLS